MGGVLVTEALKAGLVDEHIQLRLPESVPAPGVTHLRYEVVR